MAERSVRVRLTAVIDDFRRNMGEAAKATGQVGDAAQDAEKKSGRLGDAARGVGKVALTGLAVATTATVGLGLAAMKAGVNYNNLEQQSRMALTTMLGSTEAANAQMEKLVEFGRSSPFPRQVWIEAQQQLIGFGMEAERVIPTLSAIQDAAAATGRTSAADIGGIVTVFAKIQSTGRITGRELQQLGIRGIDAAGLLGQAYGKTADQIRDDITSGALDGRQALIDLTDQMSVRFAGAAEGLRQTWFGATDRIRGAFRDIGSIIAAPFVDPAGGGAAVDWANALADAMRALESVLGPVVEDIAQRAGPAFQNITDTLERAAEAMRNADVDRVTEQLGRFSPALAGLGAAGLTASAGALPFLGRFARIMVPGGPLAAGIAGFVLAVPEARSALFDLVDALSPLLEVAADVAVQLVPILSDAIRGVAESVEPTITLIGWLADAFVDAREKISPARDETDSFGDVLDSAAVRSIPLIGSLFQIKDAADAAKEGVSGSSEATDEAAESTGWFGQKAGEVRGIVRDLIPVIADNADAFDEVAVATVEAEEALDDYLDLVKRATDPVFALYGAVSDVADAQRDLDEAVKEHGPTSKEAQDAAIVLAQKLVAVEGAALDADLSFEEFDAQLKDWVQQGKITEAEADILRGAIKDLRLEAEDWDDDYIATIAATGVAKTLAEINAVKRLIASLPSRKDITIAAITGSHTPTFGITRASGGPVDGPGSSSVDSIPALLAPGEFVMKAAARAKYGDRMMAAINAGMADVAFGGGALTDVRVRHEANLDGTDFVNAAGRVTAALSRSMGLGSGRVLPRGSYRIGRGSAAHGYGALDLPAPTGTPVYSVAPGIVSRAMRLAGSYGIHAFVNHPGNRQSRYAHLSSLAVRQGATVGAGALLGRVGSTGNSTGPHLHYEDLLNGVRRWPERLGIFDRGGVLPSGGMAANTSSKPEAVLTDRQWATMHAAAAGGGSSAPARVDIRISGDGAQAEAFKASHRKGEIKILVNGQTAQVV